MIMIYVKNDFSLESILLDNYGVNVILILKQSYWLEERDMKDAFSAFLRDYGRRKMMD